MEGLEKIFQKHINEGRKGRTEYIQETLPKTDYTLDEIVGFVQEKLGKPEQNHSFGYYLTLLINAKITEHDKVVLKISPESFCKINGLGYELKKGELEIIGDAGYGTGSGQTGGTLIVKGSTRQNLSSNKKGGLTIVEVNSLRDACYCMSGGVTIVKGNLGKDAGVHMEGGLLAAEGKIKHISGCFKAGIIIEKDEIRKWDLEGWNTRTILPLEKYLPERHIRTVLDAYAEKYSYDSLRNMLKNREHEYKLRLRRLDQELPVIIKKIDEPAEPWARSRPRRSQGLGTKLSEPRHSSHWAEEKLSALKALEQEANTNPEKEIIQLAQKCGANTEEAVKKYNHKIDKEMKNHKEKLRLLRKELL